MCPRRAAASGGRAWIGERGAVPVCGSSCCRWFGWTELLEIDEAERDKLRGDGFYLAVLEIGWLPVWAGGG